MKNLGCHTIVELIPSAPFNFDATVFKPDHFPSSDNAWEPGARWQTMRWEGRYLGLKLESTGTRDQPRLLLGVFSEEKLASDDLDRLAAEIRFRYNLDLDLEEFYRQLRKDPDLGPVIERWRGARPMNPGSLYEYIVIAIVLQNATVRRSVQMLQALFNRYGERLCYDGRELSAFWLPEIMGAASEPDLRALKVGYRAKSLLRVTSAFTHGEIDELDLRQKTREEQRQALLSLYGVGPASVGYLLFDVFHQFDQIDHISPWEQKIYSRLFYGVDPETPVPVNQLLAAFQGRFSPFCNLAVHYFWEDLFWKRKNEPVEWLEKLIRL